MKSQKFDFEGKRLQIGPNSGDFVKQASYNAAKVNIFLHLWVFWMTHGFIAAIGYWGRALRLDTAVLSSGPIRAERSTDGQRQRLRLRYGRKPQYLRWTTTMEHQLFAADPSPPEIPEDFWQSRRWWRKPLHPARIPQVAQS